MANGHGGMRPGCGRKRVPTGFREFCRRVVLSKKVKTKMRERAETDPEFALRLAEHGFGKPPTSVDLNLTTPKDAGLVFRAVFADGSAVPAAALSVPEKAAGGSRA